MGRFTQAEIETCFNGCKDLLEALSPTRDIIERCEQLVGRSPGTVTITKWRSLAGKPKHRSGMVKHERMAPRVKHYPPEPGDELIPLYRQLNRLMRPIEMLVDEV